MFSYFLHENIYCSHMEPAFPSGVSTMITIRGMFEMNYLETSNFKLAQKYSFHALEVIPVARNAKFQPMYPLLEGVTVR